MMVTNSVPANALLSRHRRAKSHKRVQNKAFRKPMQPR